MAESVTIVRARANSGARIEAADMLFEFDATVSVGISDTGTVTQVPVELDGQAGSNVADHYQNAPLSITLRGIVTDTPLTDGAVLPNRALDMLTTLRTMKAKGQPITVVTNGRGSFDNMVITSVTEQQTAAQGHAVSPVVQLVQVRFTAPRVTFIPALAEAASNRRSSDVSDSNGADDAASGEDERGAQSAAEATTEQAGGLPPAVGLLGSFAGVV